MRKIIYCALFSIALYGCQGKGCQKENTIQVVDTTHVSNKANVKSNFYSIMGIDSIAKADYLFVDYNIDSISISKYDFEAIYLYCFKGSIHTVNFRILETSNPTEYNEIVNIHTSHLLSIQGEEYSFNAKDDIGCWKNIPESTMVEVNSKVYSLFSGKNSIGKILILESIKAKTKNQSHR